MKRVVTSKQHANVIPQASMPDVPPAQVALINGQGFIVSVNDAWRQCVDGNPLCGPRFSVGLNYLQVCEAAGSEGQEEAFRSAAGIQAVLGGTTRHFAFDYPTGPADSPRWFLSTATPLTGEAVQGVVVMHVDVTAERRATEKLSDSETRFRQMAENIRDVFFLRACNSRRLLYVSPAYAEVFGRSCQSVYENPTSWLEAIHPDDRADAERQRQVSTDGGFDVEYRIVRPDGSVRWIASRGYPVYDADGQPVRIAGVASDITGRKEAEQRIDYLNRVYAMLSGTSSLIIRARDRNDLFREACRIAVVEGGFGTAWIGLLDPLSMKVVPVAAAGPDRDFLKNLKRRCAAGDTILHSKGLASLAVLEKKPIVSNDCQADPEALIGGLHVDSEALSLAVLPLIIAGRVVGVLVLYAVAKEFFHAEEMKLLEDLSGNVAFAIDHIEKRERLDYLAYYDVLTGLANRTLFLERVAQYIRSAESEGHYLALFLLDISRFKNINDALGQAAGDSLLRQVADWLTHHMGDAHLVARLSGDRFALVLPQARQGGNLRQMLESAMDNFLNHPFRLNETVLRIAIKVGAAVFPQDGSTAESLFRHAEAALKRAKSGGDRYLFYAPQMSEAAGKLTLETQLRQALERDEFLLYYQPKFDSRTGSLCGAEALIRWNDPTVGLVPPGLFIPILEESGLIHEVGAWALRKAVEDNRRWRLSGLPAVRIAVNVSALQLRHYGFCAEIRAALGKDSEAPAGIELEVTESVIMESARHGGADLHEIRALGVGIGIDDFGTGFSSLELPLAPAGRYAQDRPLVRQRHDGHAGRPHAGLHHHHARAFAQAEGDRRRRGDGGPGASAEGARLRRDARVPVRRTAALRIVRGALSHRGQERWQRLPGRSGRASGWRPRIGKCLAAAHRCGRIEGGMGLRGQDLNLRPSGYEPDELPDCSTPRTQYSRSLEAPQTAPARPCSGPDVAGERCGRALPDARCPRLPAGDPQP